MSCSVLTTGGIVDFVAIGFRVFGFHIESAFKLYAASLAFSIALFMLTFQDRLAYVLMLTAVLATLQLVLPAIAFTRNSHPFWRCECCRYCQLLVACLHYILYVIKKQYAWWKLGLVIPAVILTFVVHLRSTAIWQVAILVMFSAVWALRGWRLRLPRTGPR
jgi:hypothetical protein